MSGGLPALDAVASLWAPALWRASWQGAVALALAWAACRLLPRLPGTLRCWIWRLAYLKLAVALCWSAPVRVPVLPAAAPAPSMVVPARLPELSPSRQTVVRSAAPEVPSAPAGPAVLSTTALLILFWSLGVVLSFGRLGRRWLHAQRLVAASVPVADPVITGTLEALAGRLRLRGVGVRYGAVGTPVLVGVLRPVIVLPAALEATPDELRLALAHELAHVRRRDLLWGWLPALSGCLFWFHPLVWLGRREWFLAQEMACDELTLHLTQARPAEYGALLLALAARRHPSDLIDPSVAGVLNTGCSLERRLEMLSHFSSHAADRLRAVGMVLTTLALAGIIPWQLTARRVEAAAPRTRQARLHERARRPAVHAFRHTPVRGVHRPVERVRVAVATRRPLPVVPAVRTRSAAVAGRRVDESPEHRELVRALLAAAQARQEAEEAKVQVLEARYKAGLVPNAELLEAQAELSRSRASTAYYEARAADRALAPAQEKAVAGRRQEAAQAAIAAAEARLRGAETRYNEGISTRDDLLTARAVLAQSRAQLSASRVRPGTGSASPAASAAREAQLQSAQAAVEAAEAQLHVSETRYQQGTETADATIAARAAVAQARAELAGARARSDARMPAAEAAHVAAQARLEAAQATVEAAEQQLQLGQARYKAGVETVDRVTEAQVALARARAALAMSEYQARRSEKAHGHGKP
jgi:beta-lactamase regulating signal transducer with metallopeptidase domain